MIDYELIGRRVREIRLKRSLTQEQLAEQADTSTTYVSNIERGAKHVSLEVLVKVANALGATMDELLSENLENNPDRYQMDIEILMAECSQTEQRFVFETCRSLVGSIHENGWVIQRSKK